MSAVSSAVNTMIDALIRHSNSSIAYLICSSHIRVDATGRPDPYPKLVRRAKSPRNFRLKVSSLMRLACTAVLLGVACLPLANAEPKITAVASAIQLQDGQTSGPVSLLFKVDGLKKEQQSPVPVVVPVLTSQGGPRIVPLGAPNKAAVLENGAFWQVSAQVEGLPLNSSFDAPVLVHIGDMIGEVLSYKITNVLPAVDADISPGSDTIFLQQSRDTNFTVNVKGRPLRGLAVCQSALADVNTGDHLGEQYVGLYLEPSGIAANPDADHPYLTLSAASTRVHLFISPTFHNNGVFAGTVGLCSASKAAVSTLKLTVNSSS